MQNIIPEVPVAAQKEEQLESTNKKPNKTIKEEEKIYKEEKT